MTMITEIPWLAVVVGLIVTMAFGMGWYSVFSKPWMAACGFTEEDVKGGPGATTMVITILCQLVMIIVMSGVMFHLGGFTVRIGLISAILVWVGFVITTQIVNSLFQNKPWSLILIDGGHWLGVLIIQSVAIGLLG